VRFRRRAAFATATLLAVMCLGGAPASRISGSWLSLPAIPPARADEAAAIRIIPGGYHASGKTAGGKAYEGDVEIEPLGHVKAVLWHLSTGDAYKGIGLEAGPVFGVAYGSDKPFGLVIYQVKGGQLDGRWTLAVMSGKGVGREILQGPAGLNGSYKITDGENPNGTGYTGRVEIKPTGKTYTLRWFTPQAAEIGTGILVDGVLVVAYGRDPGFGVVAYRQDGDHLHGQWAGALGQDLGSEDLTAKAP